MVGGMVGWLVVFGDYRVSPNFLVVLGLMLWLRLGLGCDNYGNESKYYIDKPKVVSQSQSQMLTTWFSLKLQCPTTPPSPPPPRKVSKKQDRAILPK